MASKITSSPVTEEPKTQNEPERLLMPENLLEAAIHGNETDLKKILGLDDEEQDHPPHTEVYVDVTQMEPSDCLRSITGMEDTILHILSANGHENLLFTVCTKDSLLLNACNARNETPFHHAARFGHKNAILELIRCAKSAFGNEGLIELLRRKNFFGETALHEAARHGHGDVVSSLMEVDVELAGLVNNDSASPLYLATVRGSYETVKEMVAMLKQCRITSEFYSGPNQQTALHAAVLHSPKLTKEVLQLYPEPLGKGTDETRKIIHFVVLTGNCDIAKLLLDNDRSLAYIKDSDGSFPVHIAVRMGHVKVLFLLLQRCLDSGQLLDCNGRNFLHIAIEAKRYAIVDKLLEDLRDKYWMKMFNIMIKTRDNNGNTPIHVAAQLGRLQYLDYHWRDIELDLSLQNQEGLTALDILLIRYRKYETTQGEYNFEEMYIRNEANHFSAAWLQDYSKDHMSETELTRGDEQDHIPTTEPTGPNKSSESVTTRAQLVGLGSVLIATVSFAAAFTLPGGTNQDTGTPILGRKYLFKAFILADFSAFFLSFISTMMLIRSSIDENQGRMKKDVDKSLKIFRFATKCLVIALALCLYLVVAHVGHTATIIIVFSSILILSDQNISRYDKKTRRDKPNAEELFLKKFLLQNQVEPKMKRLVTKISSYLSVNILFPLIFIFVFALI
ncbi:protein ACCELERATED CELL DEATH 6-like [Carex rostrata]